MPAPQRLPIGPFGPGREAELGLARARPRPEGGDGSPIGLAGARQGRGGKRARGGQAVALTSRGPGLGLEVASANGVLEMTVPWAVPSRAGPRLGDPAARVPGSLPRNTG